MAPNITHLVKDINRKIQRTWNRTNPKKSIPRHVIINLKTKNKKKVLKAARKNDVLPLREQ